MQNNIISNENLILDKHVNHKFLESRDKKGNLTYLSRIEQLKEIEDCQVVNINKSLVEKVKLSELINN
jgi:hypothetical protein